MPGEVLSGYECLQPFTIENGYKTAAAYENGQVVDSIGGGVCQISSTVYNAVKKCRPYHPTAQSPQHAGKLSSQGS